MSRKNPMLEYLPVALKTRELVYHEVMTHISENMQDRILETIFKGREQIPDIETIPMFIGQVLGLLKCAQDIAITFVYHANHSSGEEFDEDNRKQAIQDIAAEEFKNAFHRFIDRVMEPEGWLKENPR